MTVGETWVGWREGGVLPLGCVLKVEPWISAVRGSKAKGRTQGLRVE